MTATVILIVFLCVVALAGELCLIAPDKLHWSRKKEDDDDQSDGYYW